MVPSTSSRPYTPASRKMQQRRCRAGNPAVTAASGLSCVSSGVTAKKTTMTMTTTTTTTTTINDPKWPTWVIAEPSSATPSSPKYPLLPHARTNDLRKALLSAWADEKQHWRISELILRYSVKHPAEKMGAYEKERFNAAIDAVVEAMAKNQASWGGWGFYFACLMDKLQNMKVEMKDPSSSPGPVIKKEEDD